ncbi:hypothetical protein ACQJBY_015268 [Aegilops geniculata]
MLAAAATNWKNAATGVRAIESVGTPRIAGERGCCLCVHRPLVAFAVPHRGCCMRCRSARMQAESRVWRRSSWIKGRTMEGRAEVRRETWGSALGGVRRAAPHA